jgi:hypothetical protein
VVEGAETLQKLYKGYGDIPPFGTGPDQQELHVQGNTYIHEMFPHTDFLKSCHLLDQKTDRAQVLEMKYQPIEGDDDGKTSQQPKKVEAQAEEAPEEQEQEEEETNAEKLIKHYNTKHQRASIEASDFNAHLRRDFNTEERHRTLIFRALLVLVSGLLGVCFWLRHFDAQLAVGRGKVV